MKRLATKRDLPFITKLIREGAKNHHFDTNLLNPFEWFVYKIRLRLMISKGFDHHYHRKAEKYISRKMGIFVWMDQGIPVGFSIIAGDVKGYFYKEILMVSISPEHQGKGFGRKIIETHLSESKARGEMLTARCHPESKIMHNILIKKGFHCKTDESGLRHLRNGYPVDNGI